MAAMPARWVLIMTTESKMMERQIWAVMKVIHTHRTSTYVSVARAAPITLALCKLCEKLFVNPYTNESNDMTQLTCWLK